MELYCVKEKRHTPNVKGSEKVVLTKNNRKLLKTKCALCGITKHVFCRETRRALPSGGCSVLGNIAITEGDLTIETGIPFLAKKGLEAGRYYASEA